MCFLLTVREAIGRHSDGVRLTGSSPIGWKQPFSTVCLKSSKTNLALNVSYVGCVYFFYSFFFILAAFFVFLSVFFFSVKCNKSKVLFLKTKREKLKAFGERCHVLPYQAELEQCFTDTLKTLPVYHLLFFFLFFCCLLCIRLN